MVTVTILRWGYKPNYKYISCFFTVAGHQWMGPVVEPFQSRTLHMILSSNFGTCDQHWSKHFLHHWKRINLKSQIQKKSRCLSSWATQIPPWCLKHPLFIRAPRNAWRQMGAPHQSAAAATVEASPSKKPRNLKRTLEDGNSRETFGKVWSETKLWSETVKWNCEGNCEVMRWHTEKHRSIFRRNDLIQKKIRILITLDKLVNGERNKIIKRGIVSNTEHYLFSLLGGHGSKIIPVGPVSWGHAISSLAWIYI